MSDAQPLLQVDNICKAFPGVQALEDVGLTLHQGEVLAVVGENGAGKSTLMKILAGIYYADSGTIQMNGAAVHLASVAEALRRGICLIHQELNLAENLSVAANLFLGREQVAGGPLRLLHFTRMTAQAKSLMATVGLRCSAHTIVGRLSPGQRQLVEIARALSMRANIIIMDEPTSSLTQQETETLYRVIAVLKQADVAVVYISHRLAEVERIADRVVVLRDGRNAGQLRRTSPDLSTAIQESKEGITPAKQPSPSLASTGIQAQPSPRSDIISHEAMVRLMVGRELSQFFQRQHQTDIRKPRLELRDIQYLGVPGRPDGISSAISVTIHAGEILGLAGLVGAGRTELAEAIFGLRKVTAGQVYLDGKAVRLTTPRRAIDAGLLLVPEDRRLHGLILQDSVSRNISLPNLNLLAVLQMVSSAKEKEMAHQACARLRIRTPSIRQIAGLLSGGNQQKVVLGKWLVRRPNVLIVDEPTRGIDVGAKCEIYGLMDQLAQSGVAILMISSDLEEILGMSDRVAVLHEGSLQAILKREQLTEEAIMHLATGGGQRS